MGLIQVSTIGIFSKNIPTRLARSLKLQKGEEVTIRKHCLKCCGGSYLDIENCMARPDSKFSYCALWIYRMGKDPDGPSEAMQMKGMRLASTRQKIPARSK